MRTSNSSALAVLFAAATTAASTTIHVPGDHSAIQDAIVAAAEGDTVLVQPGTYLEILDFLGKSIRVTGTAPDDPATVVDADGSGRVVRFGSYQDSTCVLAGLTLTGGAADVGGGVLARDTYPTILNCVIRGNWASVQGGGVYCAGGGATFRGCTIWGNTTAGEGGGLVNDWSDVTLTHRTISANEASHYGGGIYCQHSSPSLNRCIVSDNVSQGSGDKGGGGLHGTGAAPVLLSCTIQGNDSPWHGGGLLCASGSSPTLEDCAIGENSAGRVGGGICCLSGSAPDLRRCLFFDNTAFYHGGAILSRDNSTPTLTNCLFTGNHAERKGGALSCESSSPILSNCTIIENSSAKGDGALSCKAGAAPLLTNCILWRDQPDEITGPGAILSYCDVQGGHPDTGNIDANPLMRVRRGYGALLGPESPCIDAGDPALEDRVSDWHRLWPEWYPNGARSDMGAYGGPENWGVGAAGRVRRRGMRRRSTC